jgi:hypothetical protein
MRKGCTRPGLVATRAARRSDATGKVLGVSQRDDASSGPDRPTAFDKYFGAGLSASPDYVRETLMSKSVTPESYSGVNEGYQAALLEQYKVYVEMADRISARRAATNTFFITLNTGIFTLLSAMWDHPAASTWLLTFPVIVLVGQCLAWFWLLRSYRQLNSAKYAVIGALEERLPASPYWSAEWKALGEGSDKSRYWPLTHLEQWVPLLFGSAYVAGFLALLIAA